MSRRLIVQSRGREGNSVFPAVDRHVPGERNHIESAGGILAGRPGPGPDSLRLRVRSRRLLLFNHHIVECGLRRHSSTDTQGKSVNHGACDGHVFRHATDDFQSTRTLKRCYSLQPLSDYIACFAGYIYAKTRVVARNPVVVVFCNNGGRVEAAIDVQRCVLDALHL